MDKTILNELISLMHNKVKVEVEYSHGAKDKSVEGFITNFDFDKKFLSFEETKIYIGRLSLIPFNSISRIIQVNTGEKEKVRAINKPPGL